MKTYKPRTIQEFGCDYCNKIMRTEKGMREHEKKCYYNESRECPNCYNEEEGYNSGVVEPRSMDQLIAEAKVEMKKE